ncbi:MAG: class I SAM-dependent methyltransferase [Candidatus Omnitrophota bacterium]
MKNTLSGFLPFSRQIRKLKGDLFPGRVAPEAVEQGIRQAELLLSAGCKTEGRTLLEAGPGWMPVIPIIFYLSGCKEIILMDVERLITRRTMIGTVEGLREYKHMISGRLKIPVPEVERKLGIDRSVALEKMLGNFNMQYMAPCDIPEAGLPDKSVDIITSRATLEHVPEAAIPGLLAVFNRILKDDGKMCHIIDNSDHWAHNDNSIPRLNYLKFNENIFEAVLSLDRLDYQNRLRHFEYVEVFKRAGFKIDYEKAEVDETALNELKDIKVCKRYANIPSRELAKLVSYIVASKA